MMKSSRKPKQNKNYKICIVYKGIIEKCYYRYANNKTHAINIGKMIIRNNYSSNSQHYPVVEEVK